MTRAYALMEVSGEAYREIRQKLIDAGYEHAIVSGDKGIALDMNGIGLITTSVDLVPPEKTELAKERDE